VRVATPRLARDLVRSAPRAAAAAYARSADKKLALAWLSYCLSDVDFGDAMGAAALRDAPLLPLADGTLGSFRFGDSRDPLDSDVVFVPSSESEANVLTETGRRKNDKARVLSRLVDRSVFVENDASPLYDRILAFAKSAIGANSNVKPIDAGGLASLLPDLLPDAWGVAVADSEESRREGRRVVVGVGAAVAWFPEPDGTSATSAENKSDKSEKALDHPTYETLAALWRLFVATSPNTLAPFEGWPLLPVDGGERLAPLTPHGALVRGEGWSEHAASAIRALGVSRLHECAAASVAATHTSISLYARAASAAGVLDSAVAHAAATPEAARAARAFKVEDAPTELAPELRWRAAASVVPAAFEKNLADERSADERSADVDSARRALRAFLMQTRWFASDAPGGAVEGARLDLFRALPVFETADGGFARGPDAAEISVSKFRALAGGSPARSLFVPHTGCSALEASFERANETNDALLLPPPLERARRRNPVFARVSAAGIRGRRRAFGVEVPRATPRGHRYAGGARASRFAGRERFENARATSPGRVRDARA